jgi:hypothetical protein
VDVQEVLRPAVNRAGETTRNRFFMPHVIPVQWCVSSLGIEMTRSASPSARGSIRFLTPVNQALSGTVSRSSWFRSMGEGFPIEPVRAMDARPLASVLQAALAASELRMLSLDDGVNDNARALRIETVTDS